MTVPAGYSSGTYGGGPYGLDVPTSNELPGEDTWILAEHDALLKYLTGLKVTDGYGTRDVGVWFNQPDPQIQEQNFPYLILDLIDVAEDFSREHDTYPLVHLPPGAAAETSTLAYSSRPVPLTPMMLTYQIASYARMPRHDISILTQLNHHQLHPHYAVLPADNDNTVRRLVIRSFAKRDTTDDSQNRIYRNIWTIQVPSEIYYAPLVLTKRVQSVSINDEAISRHIPSGMTTPVEYP